MPTTVTTRFVTWRPRRSRRRIGGSSSGIENLYSPTSSFYSAGGTFTTPHAPREIAVVDAEGVRYTYYFTFWFVKGGRDGNIISEAGSDTAGPVNVGSTPVEAAAIYIEQGTGGGGTGSPGVFIDAFDVTTCTFVDDSFVEVISHPALSEIANLDGYIPSASQEQVQAFEEIHSSPFREWRVVAGTERVEGQTLDIAVASSAIAFAYYTAPVLNFRKPILGFLDWNEILYGITNDGDGLVIHVHGGVPGEPEPGPEWLSLVPKLTTALRLGKLGAAMENSFQEQTLAIAAKELLSVAQAISEKMTQKQSEKKAILEKQV